MNSKDILEKLHKWENSRSQTMPMAEDEALRKLKEGNLYGDDLDESLERLTLNGKKASPRILANYLDLYAIDRLDEANLAYNLSDNLKADYIRAIMQTAEIAMLNISDLTKTIARQIEKDRLDEAEETYRWVSSLHQSLHQLSLIAAKTTLAGKGHKISITHSPGYIAMQHDVKAFHVALKKAGLTKPHLISTGDLYQSGKNLSHQAFVDSTYNEVWVNGFMSINIPGEKPLPKEDETAFYRRFVGTDYINLAVNELDQTGDNFYRQFRALHQMSEILVLQVNKYIAESIKIILAPKGNILQARNYMATAITMLDAVDKNVEPILRNLSVNRYQDFRDSLGITSGSNSPNIKKGLFSTLYPLFVAAVKSNIMGFKEYSEESLVNSMKKIVANPTKSSTTYNKYDLLNLANQLHLGLRAHRDLHIQFVKTQIGLPSAEAIQTASTSGSPSAIKAAHGMRQAAHGVHDAIAPIYETLLGKDFPAIAPFANIFREGLTANSYVNDMLTGTAQIVAKRSEIIQKRALARKKAY